MIRGRFFPARTLLLPVLALACLCACNGDSKPKEEDPSSAVREHAAVIAAWILCLAFTWNEWLYADFMTFENVETMPVALIAVVGGGSVHVRRPQRSAPVRPRSVA